MRLLDACLFLVLLGGRSEGEGGSILGEFELEGLVVAEASEIVGDCYGWGIRDGGLDIEAQISANCWLDLYCRHGVVDSRHIVDHLLLNLSGHRWGVSQAEGHVLRGRNVKIECLWYLIGIMVGRRYVGCDVLSEGGL